VLLGYLWPWVKVTQQHEFHYFVKISAFNESSMNTILSTFVFPFVLDTCEQGKMPREYKRPLGTRQYASCCEENLKRCFKDIRTVMKSQRAAAAHYQIPRNKIKNKLKGVLNRKPGRQTVFLLDEENVIVDHVKKQAEFGLPVTEQVLRFTMKAYLDRQRRRVTQFKNNMPG
jgi:hypothetical protein